VIRAWSPSEHGWPLVASELPSPPLADDSILVAVEASVLGLPERHPRPGITPGGAAVGTVVEVGAGALDLRGRRVVLGPDMACGECDVCRRAAVAACPHRQVLGRTVHGTLASAVVARARWACALDGGLHIDGPAAALIGREAAWAYTMFVRAGVGPGELVVIVGHDVVARFLVDIALAKGARPVVLLGQDRPAFAAWIHERGGAVVTVGGGQASKVLAEARAAAGHGERPWSIFATGGEPAQRSLALAAMTPGSRVVFLARQALGLTTEGHAGPLGAIDAVASADGTLLGVAGAHPDLLPEVAALVVRGELDVAGAAELIPAGALGQGLSSLDAIDRLLASSDLPRALLVTTSG
jgi:D-arabinose 1-dehydrogenase-like Zn-dependent alcohol dehydrogenase